MAYIKNINEKNDLYQRPQDGINVQKNIYPFKTYLDHVSILDARNLE